MSTTPSVSVHISNTRYKNKFRNHSSHSFKAKATNDGLQPERATKGNWFGMYIIVNFFFNLVAGIQKLA